MEEELGSDEFMFSPEFLVEELLMDEDDSFDGPGSDDSVSVKDDAALNQILLPGNREKPEISQQQLVQKQIINPWGKKSLLNSKTSKDAARSSGPLGLSSSVWPTLQQQQQKQQRKHHQPGSGTRAVFLGSSATHQPTTGTGVYLPRQLDSRPACFTVLIPGKVVEALNLTLEDSTGLVRRSQTDSSKRRTRMAPDPNPIIPTDQQAYCLPPDWTY